MELRTQQIYLLIVIVSILSIGTEVSGLEFPSKDVVRKFFEQNNVSLTPVYGVMKDKDNHVATINGFVDNLEICKEFVELLNKEGIRSSNVFRCVKFNDGTLHY